MCCKSPIRFERRRKHDEDHGAVRALRVFFRCLYLQPLNQFKSRCIISHMIRTCLLLLASAVCCVLVLPNTASSQDPGTGPAWKVGAMVVEYSPAKHGLTTPHTGPSPISRAIVFDPTEDIFVSSPPGSRLRKIADGLAPALSPDGRYVAFCGLPGAQQGTYANTQIMVIKTDGTERAQLTKIEGSPCAPAWSPDGLKIAFNAGTNKGLAVMVLDLVRSEIHFIALGSLPRWSPDGKRLLYFREPDSSRSPITIWVANADGREAKFVTDVHAPLPAASWGPDGTSIVFTNDDHHRSAIYRVNLDGTGLEELARDKYLEMYFPSLSPDGKLLAVIEEDGEAHWLQLIDLSAHKSHTLASGERGDLLWVNGR